LYTLGIIFSKYSSLDRNHYIPIDLAQNGRNTVSCQINQATATAAPFKKTLRGGAVKRASIPGPLPAIFLISILGLRLTILFCFICLCIDTDITRRISFNLYQNSNSFGFYDCLKLAKNGPRMGIFFFRQSNLFTDF